MTMDPYNKALTGPVWRRVLGSAQGEIPWQLLLSGTRRAARGYYALSRTQRGEIGEALRRLAKDKEEQFYTLSGLYRLQWGRRLELPPEKPGPREGLAPALCRRCREEAALLTALEGTGDPSLLALTGRVRGNFLEALALLGRAGG